MLHIDIYIYIYIYVQLKRSYTASAGAQGPRVAPPAHVCLLRRKQTENDNETDNFVNRLSRFTKLFVLYYYLPSPRRAGSASRAPCSPPSYIRFNTSNKFNIFSEFK